MKITDKTFPVDMADAFEQGLRQAVEADSEVFAFNYEGESLNKSTSTEHLDDCKCGTCGPGKRTVISVTSSARRAVTCHPEMKCVVLLWPAALADLLIEGVPVVRAEMEKVAAGLIDVAVKQTGTATETVVK